MSPCSYRVAPLLLMSRSPMREPRPGRPALRMRRITTETACIWPNDAFHEGF